MLATIPLPTEAARSLPLVAAAPSVVPVRFWEGDRLERFGSTSGLAWKRAADGMWHLIDPMGEQDGTPVEDSLMRSRLEWEEAHKKALRFIPRHLATTDPLPGRPIEGRGDLDALLLGADAAVPFVTSSSERRGFWSLRDLAAAQAGEEAAEYVPAVLPVDQVREALAVMLEEHRAGLSLHRPSGRLYARYQVYGPYADGEKERIQVRTFVYVLTGRR